MIVPMIKGECDGRFFNWHFDPRISTAIGLGASGTTVQYGKDYPLIPALLCEQTLSGIVALDFTTILPESGDKLSTSCMIAEITGYLENCNRDGVIAAYNSIFGTAIDWKLKLMQILDAVGQAEGVWFEPWAGVSAEEQAEIEKEYAAYEAEKTHSG